MIGDPPRPMEHTSEFDPFMLMTEHWLEDDSEYRASWVFDWMSELGYTGGYTVVEDALRKIKDRIAYVRIATEPGRQAQADFGEFDVQSALRQ